MKDQNKKKLKKIARNYNIKKQHLIFLGYCDKEKVLHHYQQSSLFILLSENEGMSNTLLEAMACKLPILTTQTGGATDLINKNGIIIKKNSNLVAQALKKLYDNPQKTQTHGSI